MSEIRLSISRPFDFISYLVKRLDPEIVRETDVCKISTEIVNFILPPNVQVDIEVLREVVLPAYEKKAYPSELTPVHRIQEIRSDMMIAVSMDLSVEQFSKLKAKGIGKLYVRDGEIELIGFWITEIGEADPPNQVVERANRLQEYVKDFIIKLLITLIVELLAKAFRKKGKGRTSLQIRRKT